VGSKPFKGPYLRTREGSVYQEPTALYLDTTPQDPPEEGVRVQEFLGVFPLGVRL
jgi:CRISPR-associated protein Csm4